MNFFFKKNSEKRIKFFTNENPMFHVSHFFFEQLVKLSFQFLSTFEPQIVIYFSFHHF